MSGSNDSFFISGVTTAFLKTCGTRAEFREALIVLVIIGSNSAKHSFIRNVGIAL